MKEVQRMGTDDNRQMAEAEALTKEKGSWLGNAAEVAIDVLGEVLEAVLDVVLDAVT